MSFKTIYRWLYKGLLPKGALTVLRHKGKRQKPRKTRCRFNVGISIFPFGHWELDIIVSRRGKSKGCFATFVEQKIRIYTAIQMKDRTSESMGNAIQFIKTQYPDGTFRSVTVDRGKEFSCYHFVEQTFGIPVYFAEPYSSWQRGSNGKRVFLEIH